MDVQRDVLQFEHLKTMLEKRSWPGLNRRPKDLQSSATTTVLQLLLFFPKNTAILYTFTIRYMITACPKYNLRRLL